MAHRPPAPARDAVAAGWIGPRLLTDFGAVCRTVPTGFEAYARIFHPARAGSPEFIRWADVAAVTQRTMHALAQFDRIVTPVPGRLNTDDEDMARPELGSLEPASLAALSEILQRHTDVLQPCWFAVWEGWSELHGGVGRVTFTRATAGPPTALRPAPLDWQLDLAGPTFRLPGRQYHLFTGALPYMLHVGSWITQDWLDSRSPNLIWPGDERWCVASEIDFDSTLVGGPQTLIDDILDSSALEAWPVTPRDSLAFDADTVNTPPAG